MSAPFNPAWISIKEITRLFAESRQKEFSGHDRNNTVGASEIGGCERRTWFTKNDAPRDPAFVERYGALERGNLIERHWVVPAMAEHFTLPVQLLYAGDEQRTLVDGYLSATSDALLVNVPHDCLAWLGVEDIGPSECLGVEIKSIDPRVSVKEAKAAHEFQTQVQMGLLRAVTADHPDYTLIAYVDASFVDEVTEFAVKFDPAIYAAAQDRARRIMIASDASSLRPEGKMAGGRECGYCPWASHCAHVTVSNMPPDERPALSDSDVEALFLFVRQERNLDAEIAQLTLEQAEYKQGIKEFLSKHGIRRYHNDAFSVAWSSTKPRITVDIAAAEAAGIDLQPYRKEGDPSDRLSIKVK
jgi:hypothetical protein